MIYWFVIYEGGNFNESNRICYAKYDAERQGNHFFNIEAKIIFCHTFWIEKFKAEKNETIQKNVLSVDFLIHKLLTEFDHQESTRGFYQAIPCSNPRFE